MHSPTVSRELVLKKLTLSSQRDHTLLKTRSLCYITDLTQCLKLEQKKRHPTKASLGPIREQEEVGAHVPCKVQIGRYNILKHKEVLPRFFLVVLGTLIFEMQSAP